MTRPQRAKPRDLVPAWPEGPANDPVGEAARLFAENLRAAIGSKSLRAAAELSGINHVTLSAILDGRAWPDIETVAKLELGLAADLWPGRVDKR